MATSTTLLPQPPCHPGQADPTRASHHWLDDPSGTHNVPFGRGSDLPADYESPAHIGGAARAAGAGVDHARLRGLKIVPSAVRSGAGVVAVAVVGLPRLRWKPAHGGAIMVYRFTGPGFLSRMPGAFCRAALLE